MNKKSGLTLKVKKRIFDNIDQKKVKWDFKNLKEGKVSFWTRFLLRIWPRRGIMRLSREFGVDPDIADKAHRLFETGEYDNGDVTVFDNCDK